MNYLTLAMLKRQLVIDDSFEDDDDYLVALGDTAEELVEQQIDKSLAQVLEDNNNHLPAPLIHAMKILVEYFYDNRGSSDSQIPDAFYWMCSLYRNYK